MMFQMHNISKLMLTLVYMSSTTSSSRKMDFMDLLIKTTLKTQIK